MSVPTLPIAPRRRMRSLAQEVVDALTAQIEAGTLRPGDKLPTETEVMKAQGVSRTVVREAISRLQASGFVETRHGIGSFVLERKRQPVGIDPATITTIRDVLAILELRISLESECASLAAQRATPEAVAALRRALRKMKRRRFKRRLFCWLSAQLLRSGCPDQRVELCAFFFGEIGERRAHRARIASDQARAGLHDADRIAGLAIADLQIRQEEL